MIKCVGRNDSERVHGEHGVLKSLMEFWIGVLKSLTVKRREFRGEFGLWIENFDFNL